MGSQGAGALGEGRVHHGQIGSFSLDTCLPDACLWKMGGHQNTWRVLANAGRPPQRKTLAGKQRSSYCKATVVTTASSCINSGTNRATSGTNQFSAESPCGPAPESTHATTIDGLQHNLFLMCFIHASLRLAGHHQVKILACYDQATEKLMLES